MAIQTSEIKWYKPIVVNDSAANGGLLSATEIIDGVKNNVWPDVPQAERITGSVKYRKSFIKIDNPDGLGMINPRIFVKTGTPGDDRITIGGSTVTATQGDIVDTQRQYGIGTILGPIKHSMKSIFVCVEHLADNIFKNGDLVRISTQKSVHDPNGVSVFARLDGVMGVRVSHKPSLVYLTFTTPLRNFIHSRVVGAKISSVYEPEDGCLFAIWGKRTVPAGAGNLSGNKAIIAISGESE